MSFGFAGYSARRGHRQTSMLFPAKLCWIVLFGYVAVASNASADLLTNSIPAELSTNSLLKKVDAGIFEIGKVRLDSAQKTITLPAVVNMDKGPVEYLLVSSTGKLHESVFR